MVYRFGIRPSWKSEVEVKEDLVINKGEFILVKNHIFNSEETYNLETLPLEKDVALDYKKQIEEKGGKVRYLKLKSDVESTIYGGWFRKYTIEECVIEGNAVPVAVIYGIIILVGIILVYYRPVILKLGGVSTWQTVVSDWGIVLPIMAIILIIIFVVPFLSKKR